MATADTLEAEAKGLEEEASHLEEAGHLKSAQEKVDAARMKREQAHCLRWVDSVEPTVDTTFPFLDAVLAARTDTPTSFEALPTSLALLSSPLPVTPHLHSLLSNLYGDHQLLEQLAASQPVVGQAPAGLCTMVTSAVGYPFSSDSQSGEQAMQWAVHELVMMPMTLALTQLGVPYHICGDNAGVLGASFARQRPDVLLSFRSVLMFKAELKEQQEDFYIAVQALRDKTCKWSPHLHGKRDYLLCLAGAGPLLQYYAVRNGGVDFKPVSKQFYMGNLLDRLQVIHSALRVLTIMLQQHEHQLPLAPTPLETTLRIGNTNITFHYDSVTKVVRWQGFPNNDEQTLQQIYQVLWKIPNGAGLHHPRGLLKPLALPTFNNDRWRVTFPLARDRMPATLDRLRMTVKDVLHGLSALHERNIVHRDVRPANILEASNDEYVLIDYEHAGVANQAPCFTPLHQWPAECKEPGASYTPAADVYSVGWVMRQSSSRLDADALAFCDQLMGPAIGRPSAKEALQLP